MVEMNRRTTIAVLGSACVIGILLGVWTARPAARPTSMIPAAASARGNGGPAVVGPGRLEPVSGEIDLAADVVGVIASIPVKEGDHIKRGQILAEFVNRDTQARVDQAAATLQMQVARLDKMKKGARTEERQQAVANLQEQDAALVRMQKDLDRQKTLFSRGYASNAQLEQAQSSAAAATAKRKSVAESLAQIQAGARAEDVASSDAEVKLAQAQLDEAKAALDRTRIRAPIDGVVLRVYKHVGEAVGGLASSAAVMQVGDTGRLVVRTQIDEADIGRIAKGARAYATAPAFPGKTFDGVVTDVSPRLGAKTIQTGAPTEKRDASVLDVLVTLDAGAVLPIGLRVDCYVLDGGRPS